ncbi:MAG TPA: F0F1 ATP synthase subunit delta [Xanthobacteraceae bacterium]|nr:F0F1 ATP synthase subunit delta [Xanthobacteraceae bacterium]
MRIDWWTLALQTVNVLILIWILGRFFFRPVMDIVAKRQQQANKLLSDAARDRDAAVNIRGQADQALADIAVRRADMIAAAHAEVRSEKQRLLAQTSQELANLRAEAETAIARDRAAAEAQIIAHASELAVEIAGRLLGRFPHRVLLQGFLDEICGEIRALPADARDAMAAAGRAGRQIEVVSAAPLSADETHAVAAMLAKAFGTELPLVFRSEPAIIAGIEIRGPNTIIRNCWAGDLDRIRQELKS